MLAASLIPAPQMEVTITPKSKVRPTQYDAACIMAVPEKCVRIELNSGTNDR